MYEQSCLFTFRQKGITRIQECIWYFRLIAVSRHLILPCVIARIRFSISFRRLNSDPLKTPAISWLSIKILNNWIRKKKIYFAWNFLRRKFVSQQKHLRINLKFIATSKTWFSSVLFYYANFSLLSQNFTLNRKSNETRNLWDLNSLLFLGFLQQNNKRSRVWSSSFLKIRGGISEIFLCVQRSL